MGGEARALAVHLITMESKTREITVNLEKVLNQVETTIDKLHTSIAIIDFSGSFAGSDLEKLKLHLGYAKNYADLAKTRLIYSKVAEYEENIPTTIGARAKLVAPRDRTIEKAKRNLGTRSRQTRNPPQ